MMPAPPSLTAADSTTGATALGAAADLQQRSHRRSSDGEPSSGRSSGTSDESGSSEGYSSDSDVSSSSDDDLSDNETLADRHAKSVRKRSGSGDRGDQPKKRRRSSSDSGSTGSGRQSTGRKRRNLFPAIRKSQRCGTCHTCLNPQLKKACLTVRERMMREAEKAMQGGSQQSQQRSQRAARAAAKPAAAAGPKTVAQHSTLSPASSGDVVDKYSGALVPLINNSGGLTDAASAPLLVKALPNFRTSSARNLPLTVLGLTTPALLSEFMNAGGVDILAGWMVDTMKEDSDEASRFLQEVLTLLKKLPVTRSFVQSTKSAKIVGALRKHDNTDVRKLAKQVVTLWMQVIPSSSGGSGSSSAKATSSPKPSGEQQPAEGASGSGVQQAAAKRLKTTAQGAGGAAGAAGANGAVGRPAGSSQVQMMSDNDLFKPAAAAKPRTPLRSGLGQPKKTGGVQMLDSLESGKLLSGTAAARQAAAAAAGPSSRLPAAATGTQQQLQRVQVELQVTPEDTVQVTLRIVQAAAAASGSGAAASAGRLPGLRRPGFGAGLGSRNNSPAGGGAAAASPGSVQALVGGAWGTGSGSDAGQEGSERKARKAGRKRVTWRQERELVAVRWFIKDDPAVNARQDAELSEEQLHALAAGAHHNSTFNQAARLEHERERAAIEAQHREAEAKAAHMRSLIAAMVPATHWHGPPPVLELDPSWQVAIGEGSDEAQAAARPTQQVMQEFQLAAFREPTDQAPPQPTDSSFNKAYYDPNVRIVPLESAQQQAAAQQQQQQQQQLQQPVQPLQAPFSGQTYVLPQQSVPVQQPQQQQQQQQQPPPPVTLTIPGVQGPPPQPQLIVQQLQQPPQQQQPVQQQAAAPAGPGMIPSSSGDNHADLMRALQSLSQFQAQGGLPGLAGVLQQQPQQQPVSGAGQIPGLPLQQQAPPPPPQLQQQQLQQQQLQQQPITLMQPIASSGPPQQFITMPGGVQLVLPPGVTPLAQPGQPSGFMLAQPPQQQQQQPVLLYQPGQQGPPPPGFGHFVGHEEHGEPPHGAWGGPPLREGQGGPYGRGGGGPGPQRHHRERDRPGAYRRGGGEEGGPGWRSNSRVCKFFNTPRGCSKGDGCDFRHVLHGQDVDVRDCQRH